MRRVESGESVRRLVYPLRALRLAQVMDQRFESKAITVPAKARDHTHRNARDVGLLSKRFPRVDVAQVHFDHGQLASEQCVAQAHTRMGQSARVDQDTVGIGARLLDPVDQQPLVVGLKSVELTTRIFCHRRKEAIDFRERRRSVDLGLARAEQVQIRTVDHENALRVRHDEFSSKTGCYGPVDRRHRHHWRTAVNVSQHG
jgi:hypothetical protein